MSRSPGISSAGATESVSYLDGNGATKEVENATSVTENLTEWSASESAWYVADSSVTITSRIMVTGAVNLILVDGKTLTAKKGINVSDGASLTISRSPRTKTRWAH